MQTEGIQGLNVAFFVVAIAGGYDAKFVDASEAIGTDAEANEVVVA